MKVKVLQQMARILNCSAVLSDKFDVVNTTLCSKQGSYHAKQCIQRHCDKCGSSKLQEVLEDLCKKAEGKTVKWNKWENKTFTDKKQRVTRKVLSDVSGCIQELVDELVIECKPFALHLHVAQWQRNQLKHLKENLPDQWIVSVEDFAENFRTVYQDEVQSAHFQYQQATLFTQVSTFKCPRRTVQSKLKSRV